MQDCRPGPWRVWRRQLWSLPSPCWCSASPWPSLQLDPSLLQLLRPVGRSLPDCCEAPAAALAPVVTAASVAERETAGCSSEEAAPPAERLPPTSFRLLGSSWTSGASEAESGRAGGELLGSTASASLLTPETWNLIGATQQKHHNKDAQLENHRQWCNQH